MNPRLSAPTTRSMFFPLNGLASNSTASAMPDGSASRGVMSRNRIPFLGKSGISRMSGLSVSIMPPSLSARIVSSQSLFYRLPPTSSRLRHHRIAQLPQRLVLDLPHALARQSDPLPDLLERHRILPVKPIPKLEDLRLALVDVPQQVHQLPQLFGVHHVLIGRGRVRVGDHFLDGHLRPVVRAAARLRRRAVRLDRLADDLQFLGADL